MSNVLIDESGDTGLILEAELNFIFVTLALLIDLVVCGVGKRIVIYKEKLGVKQEFREAPDLPRLQKQQEQGQFSDWPLSE
jgi:hypothetical protein